LDELRTLLPESMGGRLELGPVLPNRGLGAGPADIVVHTRAFREEGGDPLRRGGKRPGMLGDSGNVAAVLENPVDGLHMAPLVLHQSLAFLDDRCRIAGRTKGTDGDQPCQHHYRSADDAKRIPRPSGLPQSSDQSVPTKHWCRREGEVSCHPSREEIPLETAIA